MRSGRTLIIYIQKKVSASSRSRIQEYRLLAVRTRRFLTSLSSFRVTKGFKIPFKVNKRQIKMKKKRKTTRKKMTKHCNYSRSLSLAVAKPTLILSTFFSFSTKYKKRLTIHSLGCVWKGFCRGFAQIQNRLSQTETNERLSEFKC